MIDNNFDYPVSVEEFAAYLDGNLSEEDAERVYSIIEQNDTMQGVMNCIELSDNALEEQSAYETIIPDDILNSEFEIPDVGFSIPLNNDYTDIILNSDDTSLGIAALYENNYDDDNELLNETEDAFNDDITGLLDYQV